MEDDGVDDVRNLQGNEPIIVLPSMPKEQRIEQGVVPEFYSVDVLNYRVQPRGSDGDGRFHGDAATIGGITPKEFAAWRLARPAPLQLSALDSRTPKAQSSFEFEKNSLSITKPSADLSAQPEPEVLLAERTVGPGNTLFVFDWDDTLCPSTWMDDVGMSYEYPQVVQRTDEV